MPCWLQSTVRMAVRHFWTPGQEELLALGMLRYGYHYSVIQALLLPSMTPHQMRILVRNRTAADTGPSLIKVRSAAGSRTWSIGYRVQAAPASRLVHALVSRSRTAVKGDASDRVSIQKWQTHVQNPFREPACSSCDFGWLTRKNR